MKDMKLGAKILNFSRFAYVHTKDGAKKGGA
jgi:hypothetical protein